MLLFFFFFSGASSAFFGAALFVAPFPLYLLWVEHRISSLIGTYRCWSYFFGIWFSSTTTTYLPTSYYLAAACIVTSHLPTSYYLAAACIVTSQRTHFPGGCFFFRSLDFFYHHYILPTRHYHATLFSIFCAVFLECWYWANSLIAEFNYG